MGNTAGEYWVGAAPDCAAGELHALTGGGAVRCGKGAGKWSLCEACAGCRPGGGPDPVACDEVGSMVP